MVVGRILTQVIFSTLLFAEELFHVWFDRLGPNLVTFGVGMQQVRHDRLWQDFILIKELRTDVEEKDTVPIGQGGQALVDLVDHFAKPIVFVRSPVERPPTEAPWFPAVSLPA